MANKSSMFGFLNTRPTQVLTLLLLAQAGVFYGRARTTEDTPLARPLAEFPVQIGTWARVQEGVVEKEVQDVLQADDLLSRTYAAPGYPRGASLFVAYFRSQRTGKAPHSPKNCLPGSGWTASNADMLLVPIAGQQPIEVNRYLVSKGDYKSLVLYWYQSPGRVVASEYWAKFYLVLDSIRYNRSDTALVRVVVPASEDEQSAEKSAVDFVQAIYPNLAPFIPAGI
ncbi:MAG: EpsI family protein [Acidobacteriia bacterium]|nr:EpsI family protein [Terriglobia bacterium]